MSGFGLNRLATLLERPLLWLATAATAGLLVVVTLQVILRYGFASAPFWSEEVGRYCLVWSVLLGAAVSVRRGGHIRVDIFAERLPPRARRALRRGLRALSCALFALMAWYAVDAALFLTTMTSTGLRVPMAWPFAAVPLAFAAAALFALAGRDEAP